MYLKTNIFDHLIFGASHKDPSFEIRKAKHATIMTVKSSRDSSQRTQVTKDASQRTRVSFDDMLTVRYYQTVLGDNPSVKKGPPISIGWEFTTEKLLLTDPSQSNKQKTGCRLDAPTRIERLLTNGVSKEEMDVAYAEIYFIRRLRRINAAILRSSAFTVATGFPSNEENATTAQTSFGGSTQERTRRDDVLWT